MSDYESALHLRISQLERENAELRSLADDEQPRYTTKRLRYEVNRARSHARREALEEAATYHDDLAAQHEACQYESDHHDRMAKSHRQDAAAIRRLAEQEETDAS